MKVPFSIIEVAKAKGGPQSDEEVSQLTNFDEGGSLGVEIGPNLAEAGTHIDIEKARLLHLGVIIALEDHGNEKLEENQVYDEGIAREEANGSNF